MTRHRPQGNKRYDQKFGKKTKETQEERFNRTGKMTIRQLQIEKHKLKSCPKCKKPICPRIAKLKKTAKTRGRFQKGKDNLNVQAKEKRIKEYVDNTPDWHRELKRIWTLVDVASTGLENRIRLIEDKIAETEQRQYKLFLGIESELDKQFVANANTIKQFWASMNDEITKMATMSLFPKPEKIAEELNLMYMNTAKELLKAKEELEKDFAKATKFARYDYTPTVEEKFERSWDAFWGNK